MKSNKIQLIGYILIIGLIALTLVMAGCASARTTTSVSTPTASAASLLTIVSYTVAPGSPTNLEVGSTQQFVAVATYSNGTTKDISSEVTWTSSNASMATISNSGLATGLAAGTTDIKAAMAGATSPAIILSVVAPTSTGTTPTTSGATPTSSGTTPTSSGTTPTSTGTTPTTSGTTPTSSGTTPTSTGTTPTSGMPSEASLISIQVATASLTTNLAAGSTQQFMAMGTFSDGSTKDISSQVTWDSSNVDQATIAKTGLVTGVAAGTTGIMAEIGDITSKPVILTVVSEIE